MPGKMPGKFGTYGNPIISCEEAEELLKDGWKKADLHVHTCCSYDVPPARAMHPEVLYARAKERGLDYITFTDHDTMKAYETPGPEKEGLVPGVEIAIKDTENVGHTLHFNVFELDFEEFGELEAIAQEQDLKSFVRYLNRHDLPHVYNHPFWFAVGEMPNLWAVLELIKQFPVIEYNMQDLKQKNLMVAALAKKYGKGLVATTDSHTGGMGKACTLARGNTFREYFENIKKGNSCLMAEGGTWKHLTGELCAWVELVFNMDRQTLEDTGFTTSIQTFDKIIQALANERLQEFPALNHSAMKLFKNFSKSGLPAYMYIRSEKALLSRIRGVVNLTT